LSFLSEVQADCLEAERDLGLAYMIWRGNSYPVAQSTVRRGATLIIGGKEEEIKLTLRVRYSGTTSGGRVWEFTTDEGGKPKQGELVIYKDITYRIAQVNNAHEAFLEIDLMSRNR
jgi:hypothetical protein